jgi:hypothetical protein
MTYVSFMALIIQGELHSVAQKNMLLLPTNKAKKSRPYKSNFQQD